jgi:biotin carboxyl carrier protein
MRIRIQVEGRVYDVDYDMLDDARGGPENGGPTETPVPESVLRPRPPHRLPEDGSCRSPIAGRVTAVVGEVGGNVQRNQPVIVLEAMKMEVPIGPAVGGTVKAIHVERGDLVKTGQVLFDLA